MNTRDSEGKTAPSSEDGRHYRGVFDDSIPNNLEPHGLSVWNRVGWLRRDSGVNGGRRRVGRQCVCCARIKAQ